MRLNRFLAAAGLGSRRAVEEIIHAGRVTINGKRCETLATEVQPGDAVKVGSRLLQAQPPVYLLLNKPAGYVTTASDERISDARARRSHISIFTGVIMRIRARSASMTP